ncbi:MAG TPA: glycosyltransferase family A protein [Gemmatimonadales bacterium]|nr:glycosyltransferase family A protein [Gemmatimonadales bacterium]
MLRLLAPELLGRLLLRDMRLSIVIPTISGREESLERAVESFKQTTRGCQHEIIIIKDEPTWPEACNAGFYQSKGEVVLFSADDLDALRNWWKRPLAHLAEYDELPAPRVYDNHGPDGQRWLMNEKDGKDGDLTHFTRIPIMTRSQWERIGPWPNLIYYADMWVSEKARTLGIRTRMIYGFDFFHHWSQIGRVDSKENLDASGWHLNRLREEMV